MIKKIRNIILGWYYDFKGINYELMKNRMEICDKCDSKIRLTKTITVCAECGCPLKKKLRVKEESCLLGKW